jgi:hypothetical protein
MGVVGVVILIVVLVGVAIVLAIQADKKRTEAFRLKAEELGWPFHPKGDEALLGRLGGFHLFSKGHGKKMKNLVYVQSTDGDVALFGYQYTTGRGKESHTHRQNVAYFQSTALNVPKFALRPENIFHKIGGVMGYHDIDFSSHPVFSKQYLLRGEDEHAIREAFTDEILTFFETQSKVCVEGSVDELVYYRKGKRIKPDEVVSFLQDASEVFKLFKNS